MKLRSKDESLPLPETIKLSSTLEENHFLIMLNIMAFYYDSIRLRMDSAEYIEQGFVEANYMSWQLSA